MLGPNDLATCRRADLDRPFACARVERRALDGARMEDIEVESSGVILHVGGEIVAGKDDGEAVVVICKEKKKKGDVSEYDCASM